MPDHLSTWKPSRWVHLTLIEWSAPDAAMLVKVKVSPEALLKQHSTTPFTTTLIGRSSQPSYSRSNTNNITRLNLISTSMIRCAHRHLRLGRPTNIAADHSNQRESSSSTTAPHLRFVRSRGGAHARREPVSDYMTIYQRTMWYLPLWTKIPLSSLALPFKMANQTLKCGVGGSFYNLPPRSSRTSCRAAPAVVVNSRTVLSSGLHPQASKIRRMDDIIIIDLHLPACAFCIPQNQPWYAATVTARNAARRRWAAGEVLVRHGAGAVRRERCTPLF